MPLLSGEGATWALSNQRRFDAVGHLGIVNADMQVEELPPLDTRSLEFDVGREARRALVDLIRGERPTTIIGMLLEHRDGITVDAIAQTLQQPVGLIAWNVEKLEDEDLCVRVSMDGVRKVVPIAAYTARNT
jgi:hypothetical protein